MRTGSPGRNGRTVCRALVPCRLLRRLCGTGCVRFEPVQRRVTARPGVAVAVNEPPVAILPAVDVRDAQGVGLDRAAVD